MADAENAGTTETDNTGSQQSGDSTAEAPKFTQADLDRIVSERIAREKAKTADYADLKKKAAAAMSETERAVADAEQRGRSAALGEVGTRLARAEFRAAAAGVISTEALDGFLEYVDLKRFVTEDGEPDTKAISAAIKKLTPAAPAATNFDGGARTTATGTPDFNAMIRQAAGRA
jgi:hypothetical protein